MLDSSELFAKPIKLHPILKTGYTVTQNLLVLVVARRAETVTGIKDVTFFLRPVIMFLHLGDTTSFSHLCES